MDQSNRRKISRSRRSSTRKAAQEVNGNNQSGTSYKVENARRQKQSRDCYKNEDRNEQDHGRMGDILPNYMPMHGQRLFAAVSDPAVCGYPLSVRYPYDPIPMSLGYPLYHPTPYPHRVPYKEPVLSPRRPRLRHNLEKSIQSRDTFQTVDEYTSLPPGNLQDIESDQQRRFSDPGLANNTGSEEDSLSIDGSSASWFEDSQIASQIEALVQDNKRLSKELKETQVELQELKLEVASLTQMQSSFEPGFVSELVREVHEATKVREDTLLARLRVFSENFYHSQTPSTSSVDSKKECTKECEETKAQLAGVNLEKDELTKRLARLEDQMKTILAHNSIQEASKKELLWAEKQKLQLQEELKLAVTARSVAEASATKYERLLNSITKKLPNGLVLEDKSPGQVASLDTSESLSSSLGSGSLHSPQVTMSGPVTDL